MTMRRAVPIRPTRRGISLTEILIAIMIMGIGLVSLATLFPIGLLRIQEAQRYTRTAFLSQSAGADLVARGLLSKERFLSPYFCPWYGSTTEGGVYPFGYDPWIQDTPAPGADWLGYGNIAKAGAYRGTGGRGAKYPNQTNDPTGVGAALAAVPGPGLPVAYDPLWWYQQRLFPNPAAGVEWRFGAGVAIGVPDPSGADSASLPSVWGLQRVTDRHPNSSFDAAMVLSTFISPEDVVWQEPNGAYQDYFNPNTPLGPLAAPSPVVPDLTTAYAENVAIGGSGVIEPVNDWRYSCMFTGQQADSYSGSVLNGDVVVFENRPFGVEQLNNVITGASVTQASGEQVVQAVFGFGTNLMPVGTMPYDGNNTQVGVPIGANNTILLLWPLGTPDLEIKPGSWVADVTYERRQGVAAARFQYLPALPGSPPPPPAQRCYWYQVKRASPAADTAGSQYAAIFGAGYRFSTVYTSTPLRAKTLWNLNNTTPYHVNAALVSPFVVGVAPRTFVMP